jgi:branched-chain amino acid transport system ATP-binding protein
MEAAVIDVRIDEAGYGLAPVLRGLELQLPATGLHVLLGRNGAGKTTLLRGLMGLLPHLVGQVEIGGVPMAGKSLEDVVRAGVAFMPQEGGVFDQLTVGENLALVQSSATVEHCLGLFPLLRERRSQLGQTLSGGERKMLGLTRTLAQDTRIVLLDEPTEGVWHTLVTAALTLLREFSSERCVVLVEQSALTALEYASSAHIVARGAIALSGTGSEVRHSQQFESLLAL